MKSLKDISWQVTEEQYRADPALSYSTLAKYEREGFNNISHLFDKVETPSLTFGSCVDSIITGGEEEFNDRFFVAEFPPLGDKEKKIAEALFCEFNESLEFSDIDDSSILAAANIYEFQKNWRDETRIKVLKERCSEYYNLLFAAVDKTIVDNKTYQDVLNAVNALRNSEATSWYFAPDNPFEPNIERLYQLKFKQNLDGIDYRCMMDLCIVLHDEKKIIPIDLKTSSHTEYDFYKSFKDWMYMIQARLYARLLKKTLEQDDYFKDFTVSNYVFVVVNKGCLCPLTWEYDDTFSTGTLYYGKNKQIECRDPEVIGKELKYYLDNQSKVPIGINMIELNNLTEWLNKL